jgi:5-methylcytosine-specific restriction endonuclease McrA
MATPYTRPTRGNSEKCRRIVLETHGFLNRLGRLCIKCVGCGVIIEAQRGSDWDAEHRKTVAEGGDDSPANLDPMCTACHDRKTNTQDIPRIAKGKQQRDRHFGVKRSAGSFRRPGYRYNWKTGRYERIDTDPTT